METPIPQINKIIFPEDSFSAGRLGDKSNVILSLIILANHTNSKLSIDRSGRNKDFGVLEKIASLNSLQIIKCSQKPRHVCILPYMEARPEDKQPDYTNISLFRRNDKGEVSRYFLDYVKKFIKENNTVRLKDCPKVDLGDFQKAYDSGVITKNVFFKSVHEFRSMFPKPIKHKEKTVAIHIRRQDSAKSEIERGFNIDYYLDLINLINSQAKEPLRIKVFSQKENSSDITPLSKIKNVDLLLGEANDNGATTQHFIEMYSADILFPAKSYYSMMASMVCDGVVFYNKKKKGQPHIARDRSHEFNPFKRNFTFSEISDIILEPKISI